VLHIDFLEVDEKKSLTIKIPVRLVGRSKGVANGGALKNPIKMQTVSGLPAAIPEFVELDITELKIGDSIKVSDLNIPGLTFLGADNAVVAGVKMSRNAVADEEEGAEATAEAAVAE
jgi:large subunit ribosomal protein L25